MYGDEWNSSRLVLHHHWGRFFRNEQRYAESEQIFREIEAVLESDRFPDGTRANFRPRTVYERRLSLYFHMQLLYWRSDSIDKSIEYGRKVVRLYDEQLYRHRVGNSRTAKANLILSLRTKASNLFAQGKVKEAVEFYREELDLIVDLWGEGHENVKRARRELAGVTRWIRNAPETSSQTKPTN